MTHKRQPQLIQYKVIELAIQGDSVAIEEVLLSYSSYIYKLSSRSTNGLSKIDEYMRGRLELKLMAAILKFDITR